MLSYFRRFLREEKGPTAVEYAIMLALVALAIAASTPGIRDAVISVFSNTAGALTLQEQSAGS